MSYLKIAVKFHISVMISSSYKIYWTIYGTADVPHDVKSWKTNRITDRKI